MASWWSKGKCCLRDKTLKFHWAVMYLIRSISPRHHSSGIESRAHIFEPSSIVESRKILDRDRQRLWRRCFTIPWHPFHQWFIAGFWIITLSWVEEISFNMSVTVIDIYWGGNCNRYTPDMYNSKTSIRRNFNNCWGSENRCLLWCWVKNRFNSSNDLFRIAICSDWILIVTFAFDNLSCGFSINRPSSWPCTPRLLNFDSLSWSWCRNARFSLFTTLIELESTAAWAASWFTRAVRTLASIVFAQRCHVEICSRKKGTMINFVVQCDGVFLYW